MPIGRSAPQPPNSISPWLLFRTTRQANLSIQIAEDALRDISDSVRRVLDYSSESDTEAPANITHEREYQIYAHDFSWLGDMNGQNRWQTPTDENNYGRANMAHSPVDASNQMDGEIHQQNLTEPDEFPNRERRNRRIAFNVPSAKNMLLHELLQEIWDLRIHLIGNAQEHPTPPRVRNRNTQSFHENALYLTYGRSHRDVRSQHRSTALAF